MNTKPVLQEPTALTSELDRFRQHQVTKELYQLRRRIESGFYSHAEHISSPVQPNQGDDPGIRRHLDGEEITPAENRLYFFCDPTRYDCVCYLVYEYFINTTGQVATSESAACLRTIFDMRQLEQPG